MTNTTSKFDVAKYLVDDQTIANYLDDCMEEGGTPLFLKAVGEVARARGMSEIAASAGLTRASLYKSLGEAGNPALSTMERVIDSLGFRLSVVPKNLPVAVAGVRQAKVAKAVAKRAGGAAKKVGTARKAMAKTAPAGAAKATAVESARRTRARKK